MRPSSASSTLRAPSVLPGFGLTLGVTLFMLSTIVLIPLAALIARPWEHGWSTFIQEALDERTLAALRLSFGAALIGASINLVFGLIVAWMLVRYDFLGKRVLDALVDLPFALPTAVAGIALTTLYAPNGLLGGMLEPLGVKVAYTPLGVIVALTFVGLPFVVRTVQPVLEDLDPEVEEAAATLGAKRIQTLTGVILPQLMPALVTGFAMALARGVGEYGSVIFIAGNLPLKTEIAPLLIVMKLEEFNYAGAATIGVLMLAISFVMLLLINLSQSWAKRLSQDD